MKLDTTQLAELLNQHSSDVDSGAHPSTERLVGLLDHSLPDEERETTLLHLETCPACSAQLRVLLELEPELDSFATALEKSSGSGSSPELWPTTWWPLAAAASVVMLLGLLWFWLEPATLAPDWPAQTQLRGDQSGLTPAQGELIGKVPPELVWPGPIDQPVRVRLMDATATTLWQSDPSEELSARVPESLMTDSQTYFWQIESSSGEVLAGPYWFRVE